MRAASVLVYLRSAHLLLVASLFGAGCHSSDSLVPLYPAEGELFVRGKPAAGALVVLHPCGKARSQRTAAEASSFATGFPRAVVDRHGRFRVGTIGDTDGAPAGDYVALIYWPYQGSAGDDPESALPAESLSGPPLLLDDRYRDPRRSDLLVTVHARRHNRLPRFDLR